MRTSGTTKNRLVDIDTYFAMNIWKILVKTVKMLNGGRMKPSRCKKERKNNGNYKLVCFIALL